MSSGRAGTLVELADADTVRAAWPVVRQLRAHLTEDNFVAMVGASARRVIAPSPCCATTPCAYAGFRILTMLLHDAYCTWATWSPTRPRATPAPACRSSPGWWARRAPRLRRRAARFGRAALRRPRLLLRPRQRIAAHPLAMALDDHRD